MLLYSPLWSEPRSTLLALWRSGASTWRLLIVLMAIDDWVRWALTALLLFAAAHFDRFIAAARYHAGRTILDARTTVHLNHHAWYQLLYAFHFSCLIHCLVVFAAEATAPFAESPECGTRLGVTFQQVLVHNGLLGVSTLLWRESTNGLATHTTDYRLLGAAAARFAAWCESY